MTPDVAVVIPLKLVYTPVDDNVTAPICSQSQSQKSIPRPVKRSRGFNDGSPTVVSPSQPDTKKCSIQVGRETYAVTSQPGTSYTPNDYDSISVIDSSSPSAPKQKPKKKRKPNRHNNRHHKEDARAMDSFSAGSRL